MNKKAYVKTIEAIIAIVIILIFIYSVMPRDRVQEPTVPGNIELLQKTITNEIENNKIYRDEILKENVKEENLLNKIDPPEQNSLFPDLNLLMTKTLTSSMYGYQGLICEEGCNIPEDLPDGKTVYSKSILIAESLPSEPTLPTGVNTKIFYFYIWYK